MEYYSVTKKNKIMPFVETWMDWEIVILNQVSQTERRISYDIAYMWNLKKNGTDEFFYKKEIESWM